MEVDAVRGSPSPPFVGERRRRPRLTRARRSREIAADVRGQRKPTAARGQCNMPCLRPQSTLQCPPVLAPRKHYAVPVHVYIFYIYIYIHTVHVFNVIILYNIYSVCLYVCIYIYIYIYIYIHSVYTHTHTYTHTHSHYKKIIIHMVKTIL